MTALGKMARQIGSVVGLVKSVKPDGDDAELLETIRKNVELDAEATSVQRALELDDLRFCDPSTQWSDADRREREGAGRPCLTEDHLGPFLRIVCNEQRKNKPAVQVNPVDSDSDVETAEVIQGLIRHIEYDSNADTAYDTAFEWAVSCGRGFYRLTTDYVDQTSFEQEILVRRVPNPHMVFVDPAAQESDYSDMKWGGFKAWVSQDDFKRQYPESEIANTGTAGWMSIGDEAPEWMSEDHKACLVVEYYYKEQIPAKLYKLKTGEVTDKIADGQEVETTRDYLKTQVRWVKCTATEILERRDIPGEYIPIVAVLGRETTVDGHRTYAGLIRAGKDPQKRYNYLLTAQVERIAFMPLATWLGPKGFMGKNKAIWQNIHKNQMAALEFEIIGDDGQTINRPQLITEEAPIVAVSNALEGAAQGVKSVLGMYDANLGNRQADESGVAIQRLQAQGETGTYHFQDALSRAMRYEGRILLGWIPVYYDTERIIRTIGDDDEQRQVRINGPVQNPEEALEKTQVGKVFDLTTGKYDVTISSGPSYQSKRQEDRALLVSMLQGPMGQIIANRAGDLVAKTLDSPIAKALAERLTPSDIAAQEKQNMPVPPQAQQQMQQAGQMIQQLTATVHQLQDKLDAQQVQADSRLQVAAMQEETKRLIALLTVGQKSAVAELQHTIGVLESQADRDHQMAIASLPPQAPAGTPAPASNPPAVPAGDTTAGPAAGQEMPNE